MIAEPNSYGKGQGCAMRPARADRAPVGFVRHVRLDIVVVLLDLRLNVGKLLPNVVLVDLGFGRIVVSETEAPNEYV